MNYFIHPLRSILTKDDLHRIQRVFDGDNTAECTIEEYEAALDILFDGVIHELQTHKSILTLQ
jgi:hypothetical protein|tara:strand:+ start:2506 stop:2694 length:189 start_codon:yes stop_codon:yes gene_type:complete